MRSGSYWQRQVFVWARALGLAWSDLDLLGGRLSVRRALQHRHGQGFVFVEPKSTRSRRLVFLASGTVDALVQHQARQADEQRDSARVSSSADLVFTSMRGTPLQDGYVSWCFHKALASASLPSRRIHDLRHTTASILLEFGVNPKVVQEMLGHSTVAFTLETYSHVVPGIHLEAARQIQNVFGTTEAALGLTSERELPAFDQARPPKS